MLRLLTRRVSVTAAALIDVRPALVVSSCNVQLVGAARLSLASDQQSAGKSKAQPDSNMGRLPGKYWRSSAGQIEPAAIEPHRASLSAAHSSPRPALDSGDLSTVRAAPAGIDVATSSVNSNNETLRAFSRADQIASMEKHFAAMPEYNPASYTVVTKALVRSGDLRRAGDYLERLIASFRTPGVACVSGIFRFLAAQPGLDGQQRLLELIRRSGFRPEGSERLRLHDSLQYLDGMPAKEKYVELLQSIGVEPDLSVLNMLIGAAAKIPDVARAEHYFAQIAASGLQPDAISYTSMMECYGRAGRHEMCFELEQRMRTQGVALRAGTFLRLLIATGYTGQSARIGLLLEEYLRCPYRRNPAFAAFSAAVRASARCRDYDGVRRHLAVMQQHDVAPTVGLARFLAFALPGEATGRAALLRALPPAERRKELQNQLLTADQRAAFDRVVADLGRKVEAASTE